MEKKMKKCIVTLIEDDIVNFKLISSLSDLGIEAGCYESNSTSVIRYLMGYEDERNVDEWYDKYYDLIRKGKRIDISIDRTTLHRIALEIFHSLKPL